MNPARTQSSEEEDLPVFSASIGSAGNNNSSHHHRHNNNNNNNENPAPSTQQLTVLVQQVQQQLLNHSDTALVQEYRHAAAQCPGLVASETRVEDFLRTVHYDVPAAVDRLAHYWKMRKLLFGNSGGEEGNAQGDSDRWLLPMRQTGTGCLNSTQIEILRSGFFKVVPASDTHGPVWIADFTLLPKGVPRAHQPWITFYLGTVCTCKISQSPGISLLIVVQSGQRPPLEFSSPSTTSMLVVPVRIDRLVIAQVQEVGKEHLMEYLGYHDGRVISESLKRPGTIRAVVPASSPGFPLSSKYTMQKLGLPPTCLPACLGGDIDEPFFANWIRMRLSVENVLAAAPALSNSSLTRRKRDYADEDAMVVRKVPGESLAQYHKRRQAAYARRSYHRRKGVGSTWNVVADQQRALQAHLVAEGKRLEDLLARAIALVKAAHNTGVHYVHVPALPVISSSIIPIHQQQLKQNQQPQQLHQQQQNCGVNAVAPYPTELDSFSQFLDDIDL